MNSPTAITLMLGVSGGGDFGPFFAAVTLDRIAVEMLLHRADVFRAAHRLDDKLYMTTYFDYSPEFYESNWDNAEDFGTPEQVARVKAIFEDGDYPDNAETPPRDAPDDLPEGNVRVDYSKLIVAGSMSQLRPGQVDYNWVASIKHTDIEIETSELKEEDIRALLGRLA
jgi:hypothetical protein